MNAHTKVAGIILAGGKSTRMGRSKADLPFGPERMLDRVIRLLSTVVSPIVVVAAPNQQLDDLPPNVLITHDAKESRGPLEGLRAGLAAIVPHAQAAYATSCDVPLLVPAFVTAMIDQLGDFDIAVPVEGDFAHPLAAVYRITVLPKSDRLLAANQLRPASLFEMSKTRRVPVDELRTVDPLLTTLRNLNHPEDYLAALAEAGFQPDPAILAALATPRTSEGTQ